MGHSPALRRFFCSGLSAGLGRVGKRELKALGFTFGDSKTNFIFAKHSTVDAEVIFDKLREKHIFVRHFSGERIRNYLRISIGTMAEMEKFIDELSHIV